MPCRINLRHDQTGSQIDSSTTEGVLIFAPTWVQEGLHLLGQQLKGITFQVYDKTTLLQQFTLSEKISLNELQKITRVESHNVTGIVQQANYNSEIHDPNIIYSLRNIVRQCIIVGKDLTTHYGGYPGRSPQISQSDPVYICDLAALQFQRAYNSGRQVLICKETKYEGPIEELIFQKITSEKKKLYEEIDGTNDKRYFKVKSSLFGNCYLDTEAYKKFVAHDVHLTGVAFTEIARKNGDKINFKFLKYGTGFFAGEFGSVLNEHILSGVIQGLERLFGMEDLNPSEVIKNVEFPFYTQPKKGSDEDLRLQNLSKNKFTYTFSGEDALKSTKKGLITATTNCGDTHAVFGNEMQWSSVDGAVAENLKSKGNIFCPNLNKKIQEKFVTL